MLKLFLGGKTMKKVLGVLALVLSVSSLALADQNQDTLKEIHFSTE